ncbi:MAG: hypothetical protein V1875_08135 [Candidatus Altiarchaeota archaeon]
MRIPDFFTTKIGRFRAWMMSRGGRFLNVFTILLLFAAALSAMYFGMLWYVQETSQNTIYFTNSADFAGWTTSDIDESVWTKGPIPLNSVYSDSQLLVRTTLVSGGLPGYEQVSARVIANDCLSEFYMNGQLIFNETNCGGCSHCVLGVQVNLTEHLRPGVNTVAFKILNSGGAQVGFTWALEGDLGVKLLYSVLLTLLLAAVVYHMRKGFRLLSEDVSGRHNAAVFLILCLLVYSLVAGERNFQVSVSPQNVYLAEAYAQGRLGMDMCLEEMVQGVDGKCYNPQGPMPAALMAPFAYFFGHNVSDYSFTVFLASLAGAAFMLVMFAVRARGAGLSVRDAWTYSALFSFGTIMLVYSTYGSFWIVNQITSVLFITLFLLFVVRGTNPFLVGAFLGASMLARYHTVLFIIIYFAYLAMDREKNFWKKVHSAALASVALSLFLGVFLAHNFARFGDPLDASYSRFNGGVYFDLNRLGPHLSNVFFSLPTRVSYYPYFMVPMEGLSVFLTTPLFLYILRIRYGTPLLKSLLIGCSVYFLFIMAYPTNGWAQFGYRYLLEINPFLVAMLALNRENLKPGKLFIMLLVLGMAVNLFGALTFKRPPIDQMIYTFETFLTQTK